jgi:hypothetical protein
MGSTTPLEALLAGDSVCVHDDPRALLLDQLSALGVSEPIAFLGRLIPDEITVPFVMTQLDEQARNLKYGIFKGTLYVLGKSPVLIEGEISDERISFATNPLRVRFLPTVFHEHHIELGYTFPGTPEYPIQFEAPYDVEKGLYVGEFGPKGWVRSISSFERHLFEIGGPGVSECTPLLYGRSLALVDGES